MALVGIGTNANPRSQIVQPADLIAQHVVALADEPYLATPSVQALELRDFDEAT